eukprot:Clim_evm79s144 gene=Clim_evmTU79s144
MDPKRIAKQTVYTMSSHVPVTLLSEAPREAGLPEILFRLGSFFQTRGEYKKAQSSFAQASDLPIPDAIERVPAEWPRLYLSLARSIIDSDIDPFGRSMSQMNVDDSRMGLSNAPVGKAHQLVDQAVKLVDNVQDERNDSEQNQRLLILQEAGQLMNRLGRTDEVNSLLHKVQDEAGGTSACNAIQRVIALDLIVASTDTIFAAYAAACGGVDDECLVRLVNFKLGFNHDFAMS